MNSLSDISIASDNDINNNTANNNSNGDAVSPVLVSGASGSTTISHVVVGPVDNLSKNNQFNKSSGVVILHELYNEMTNSLISHLNEYFENMNKALSEIDNVNRLGQEEGSGLKVDNCKKQYSVIYNAYRVFGMDLKNFLQKPSF